MLGLSMTLILLLLGLTVGGLSGDNTKNSLEAKFEAGVESNGFQLMSNWDIIRR